MKQVSRFLPVVMALMLVFTGIDKKGSFDINAGGTTKGDDVPVIPGLVAGSSVPLASNHNSGDGKVSQQ